MATGSTARRARSVTRATHRSTRVRHVSWGRRISTHSGRFRLCLCRHGAEHVASFANRRRWRAGGLEFSRPAGAASGFSARYRSAGAVEPRPSRSRLSRRVPTLLKAGGCAMAACAPFRTGTKHVWLYQKFGFYPRYLTAIAAAPAKAGTLPQNSRYSALAGPGTRGGRGRELRADRPGFTPGSTCAPKSRTVAARQSGRRIAAVGRREPARRICPSVTGGRRARAGMDCLFIKFGAVPVGCGRPMLASPALLGRGGALAAVGRVMGKVLAGVNSARRGGPIAKWRGAGFAGLVNVVTMHRRPDRDRGPPRASARPPTPPGIRVSYRGGSNGG